MLAGRCLPFYMSTAVVFATWFGSETLLGASAEFAQHGLLGVIEDPFGAALCLVLVGVFFARRLYRMNLLKPQLRRLSDRQLLRLSRISVLVVAAVSLGLALSTNNIYELVGESSALSLVSLLVPLVAGMFWKKATPAGALLSITAGMLVWLLAVRLDTELNPMLWGLAASVLGQLTGALMPQKVQQPLASKLQEAAE